MERQPVVPAHASRRAFIAGLSAAAVAPALLTACREEAPEAALPTTSDDDSFDSAAAAARGERRPPLPEAEPVVRVRVRVVRDRAARVRFGEDGQWIALRTPEAEPSNDEPATEPGRGGTTTMLYAPVTVGLRRKGWTVIDARGFRAGVSAMEPLELSTPDAPDGVVVDGQPYPGYVHLVRRGEEVRDGWYVVNHVPLEQYLPGVVASELYSHWRLDTYAAQAIAARSYACAERTYRGHRPYDLTNTTSSQVYGGRTQHTRALEAVAMTRGMVLAHHGLLVPGYYSACCGGRAAMAVDAFGVHPYNDVAPLRGSPHEDVCVKAPLFTWTIERPAADVATRVAAYAKKRDHATLVSATRVRLVEPCAVNPYGRPVSYAVTTDAGGAVLSARAMRSAVDFTGAGMKRPDRRLWSPNFNVSIEDDAIRFVGHGHGHGVGMCQHGAETLARASKNFESILGWYYPGVEIVRAYG